MQPRFGIAAAALTTLLLSSPLAVLAAPLLPQQLSQATPNTVTGQLDSTNRTLNDGSYFNAYTFEGVAGERIVIDLVSVDFDAYLILVAPNGQSIAQNDDGGQGTNARISIVLPATGTYQIVANSYRPRETGRYTLTFIRGWSRANY